MAKKQDLECDVLLVSIGRRPYTKDLGLDSVQLKLDDKGRVPVNEKFLYGMNLEKYTHIFQGINLKTFLTSSSDMTIAYRERIKDMRKSVIVSFIRVEKR